MEIKIGDTWKIMHSRKGALTIHFTADGDTSDSDSWLHGEIVDGRVKYMSDENRLNQRAFGHGTPGDDLTMRASFVQFIQKLAP